MPNVTVTRRLRFNAAHRVHNPALSDEENRELYGKCNNPNWHGHNYDLEVSVRGPVDERTGYVIDLGRLKRIAEELVVDQVDHRNMNVDVRGAGVPRTTIRQISTNTPSVSSPCSHPGASPITNVPTPQMTSMASAATTPRSVSIRMIDRSCAGRILPPRPRRRGFTF